MRLSVAIYPFVGWLMFTTHGFAGSDQFYRGKTIRLVVGYAPGGYDFYAHAVARYMGKHITGNPAFVVDNMPGAGSLAQLEGKLSRILLLPVA